MVLCERTLGPRNVGFQSQTHCIRLQGKPTWDSWWAISFVKTNVNQNKGALVPHIGNVNHNIYEALFTGSELAVRDPICLPICIRHWCIARTSTVDDATIYLF